MLSSKYIGYIASAVSLLITVAVFISSRNRTDTHEVTEETVREFEILSAQFEELRNSLMGVQKALGEYTINPTSSQARSKLEKHVAEFSALGAKLKSAEKEYQVAEIKEIALKGLELLNIFDEVIDNELQQRSENTDKLLKQFQETNADVQGKIRTLVKKIEYSKVQRK